MRVPSIPPPAKLFCGLLYNNEKIFDRGIQSLQNHFGPLEAVSDPVDFDFTDYYLKEMGPGLIRKFAVFKRLFPRDQLVNAKHKTISIEKQFSRNKNDIIHRELNVDPGYLTAENLILSTTKGYSHRIYLDRGIYAEVSLEVRKKKFHAFPWTYPDYRLKEIWDFFWNIRQEYLKTIKSEG